jgi:hypothetical protein
VKYISLLLLILTNRFLIVKDKFVLLNDYRDESRTLISFSLIHKLGHMKINKINLLPALLSYDALSIFEFSLLTFYLMFGTRTLQIFSSAMKHVEPFHTNQIIIIVDCFENQFFWVCKNMIKQEEESNIKK